MAQPKIEVTVSGIRDTVEKNLATALQALTTSEDLGTEMDMLEDLDLSITHDCRDKEEPSGSGSSGSNGMNGAAPEPNPNPQPCEEKPAAERAQSMAKDMVEDLFESDKLELDESKRVVYKFEAECPSGDQPLAPPPGNSMPPPEPSTNCDPVEIRLSFTSVRAGDLDVAILVGENQLPLANVQLYEKSASVAVDLADAFAVINEIQRLTGASDDAPLPDSMTGAIMLAVANPSAGQYTASFSITRAIQIISSDPQASYRIAIAATNPGLSVAVNEMARSITSRVDWKAIDVQGMAELIEIEGATDGPVAIHLGGMSAQVTISENGSQDSFEIKDVSMGNESTYATYNNQRIFTVDLNESHGRKFNLTLNDHADGLSFGLSPAFDLKAVLNLASLFTNPDDRPPEWLLNEEFQVTLDGASLPTLLAYFGSDDSAGTPVSPPGMGGTGGAPAPEPEAQKERVTQVLDGLLSLKAKVSNKNITVPAGSCLLIESSRDGEEPREPSRPGSSGDPEPPPNGGMAPDDGPEHPFDVFSSGACD